jgi:hypothetical protein
MTGGGEAGEGTASLVWSECGAYNVGKCGGGVMLQRKKLSDLRLGSTNVWQAAFRGR